MIWKDQSKSVVLLKVDGAVLDDDDLCEEAIVEGDVITGVVTGAASALPPSLPLPPSHSLSFPPFLLASLPLLLPLPPFLLPLPAPALVLSSPSLHPPPLYLSFTLSP
jgi:hypothetical protein